MWFERVDLLGLNLDNLYAWNKHQNSNIYFFYNVVRKNNNTSMIEKKTANPVLFFVCCLQNEMAAVIPKRGCGLWTFFCTASFVRCFHLPSLGLAAYILCTILAAKIFPNQCRDSFFFNRLGDNGISFCFLYVLLTCLHAQLMWWWTE